MRVSDRSFFGEHIRNMWERYREEWLVSLSEAEYLWLRRREYELWEERYEQ